MFSDQLIELILARRAPVCVGIDPMIEQFPDALAGDKAARAKKSPRQVVDCYYDFVLEVLKIVAPLVPIVKFQSAYFEQYHADGVEAYFDLINEAKQLGLLVIGDAKRGDIGSTSEAYAKGHLLPIDSEDAATPDALTINPMLGMDAIEPFLQACEKTEKGAFVLVRTSNPGSKDFQDVDLKDGRTWSEHVAETLQPRITTPSLMGQHGYSNIGAVVGATQTHTMQSLRKRLPQSIFLLPGYGTQGATADMTRAAFDSRGLGAIVSASRSVLYPRVEAGESWQQAVARATTAMIEDVRKIAG
ncbi:MAG: orotidine-5'-phosphate decarboxylase [Tepidisphaeraceae bacterium]